MKDPIAYSYDAQFHCPSCAEKAHGRDMDGDIDGEDVGALAPWDEWQQFDGSVEMLVCGTCGDELDRYDPVDT